MIERIKSTTFWVSLIGAVFLILGAFGVEIGDQTAATVVNAVCSVLVMFGIVKPDGGTKDEKADGDPDEDD